MEQISNDDGSGGYHRPCAATAALTSALSSPGCTTAVRVTGSTVISRIFSVDSTIPPSTAVAPPDRPVPAPRGTTGMRWAVAQRNTVCTCSVLDGRTTAIGVPQIRVGGAVLSVGRHDVGVGDDDAVGQFGDQGCDLRIGHGTQSYGPSGAGESSSRSCGNTTDTNPTTSIGTASARKVTVSPAASASGPATIRPTGPAA